MKAKLFYAIFLAIIMVVAGPAGCNSPSTVTPGTTTASTGTTNAGATSPVNTSATATITSPAIEAIKILVTELEIPWALDFIPDGNIVFTERPGRVNLLQTDGRVVNLLTPGDVVARGEGGMMGIAVHPRFETNNYIYVYYTYRDTRNNEVNHVVRYIKEGNSLRKDKIILDGIPAGTNHHGGRIKFGPDGYLYIASGDAGNADAAQDLNSLNGKILRITDDGGIPEDNPFPNSPVYSYGHRNPEGLTWDDRGRLWATEHGSSATDELNLIEPGNNYGWPVIRGNDTREGMVTPVIQSGSDTWAPSGAAFYGGGIFFCRPARRKPIQSRNQRE